MVGNSGLDLTLPLPFSSDIKTRAGDNYNMPSASHSINAVHAILTLVSLAADALSIPSALILVSVCL